MKQQIIKIGMPLITQPNMVGVIIRETKKMVIVTITGRTFETKRSATLTHKFTKGQRKWYTDGFTPFGRRFWKETGMQVGGEGRLIDYLK